MSQKSREERPQAKEAAKEEPKKSIKEQPKGGSSRDTSSSSRKACSLVLGSAPPSQHSDQPPSASSVDESSALYSVALPEGWGDLRVRYKQRPPQPEDENHDLQLLFRVDEGTATESALEEEGAAMVASGQRTQRMAPRENAKASGGQHCPPPKTAAKWSPPIVKYVTAKWNEWQYLKEGPKTVELEVAQVSSRPPGPESVTVEEVQQLRKQFDAMLARIAPARPVVAQTAQAQPTPTATPSAAPATTTPTPSTRSSRNDTSSKANKADKCKAPEKKQSPRRKGAS